VYIENDDLTKLTGLAKDAGKVVGEYVRDLILETVAEAEAGNGGGSKTSEDVPRVRELSVGARGADESGGFFGPPAYQEHAKSCHCGVCEFARGAGLK